MKPTDRQRRLSLLLVLMLMMVLVLVTALPSLAATSQEIVPAPVPPVTLSWMLSP